MYFALLLGNADCVEVDDNASVYLKLIWSISILDDPKNGKKITMVHFAIKHCLFLWQILGGIKVELSACFLIAHYPIHKTKIDQKKLSGIQLIQQSIFCHMYSTGYGDCSTHTRVQCVQYGGFTRQLHAQCARVKFYTQCYTHPNYTQYLRVFY